MMMSFDFELGGDRTNPRVESDSVVDGSNSENRVDSASVHLIGSPENFIGVQGVESVGGSVAEGSMGSVSAEGNVSDVNNRIVGDSDKLGVFESNDKDVFSDRNHGSIKHVKSEQQKGQRRKEGNPKESICPVYDSMLSMFDDFAANGSVATVGRPSMELSPGHGFEVGDMVWGKVKSHPWWPGHVYSEGFANPSVRRSKREGLLLVAFFGDSSYGWFDPSELIPFDSNFAEKSRQTNSRNFVKAVEEAMDEVSRRSGLGLSCMCRNKQNFRQTDVQGFFAVDVPDYEPGAVYSIDAIGKARDSFQPSSALDFIRQLALEPTGSEHAGIDFVRNKATVMSYRKAVYEEFDETYAQAFGYQPVRPSPGSVQELPPGRTLSKAPLSGRQVFADTLGKGKSPAKPNKPKDLAKKDKYLFKRRDEPKEVKIHQKEKGKVALSSQPGHVEDPDAIAAGDYMLKKRVSANHEQIGTTVANDELALRDATGTGAGMEDTPIVLEFGNPGFQMITSKVESPSSSAGEVAPDCRGHLSKVKSVDEERRIVPEMEDRKTSSGLVDDKSSSEAKVFTLDDIPSSGPHKIVATQRVDSRLKKVKVSKRPVGELGSGKSVLPEKKKKRKKELSMSDSTHIRWKEGVPLVDKVSANKSVQSALAPKPPIEGPHRTDGKATTSSSSHTVGAQETTGLGNSEVELPRVLGDLHSLALDPFHAINRGWTVKVRQVFLRFRSLVFQKSLNLSSLAEDEANDTYSSKSPAVISVTCGSENGTRVPPVKPQARSSGRPEDPTKGGSKRGPSDRLEEIAAKKKKKFSDIRNLTKEKKVIKKIDEPAARGDGKQAVVMTPKKLGPESIKKTEQRVPEPTMLVMKFPSGGSLPSINELKARFARYGPMDHSATRIYWNTFTCRVVYRHKAHAQAAYKFVVGSSSLFGNTDVKCSLKEVGVVGSAESEPLPKVPKEDASSGTHQPAEDRPSILPAMPGLQLKSCLKKSGGEEAGGNGGNGSRGMPRVKFMLGGDESHKKNNLENKNGSSFGDGGASSFSSSHATMDFNSKNFHKAVLQSSHPLPLLPLQASTSITSSTAQFTRLPPSSMHYGTALVPPPRSSNYGSDLATPTLLPPPPLPQLPGNFVHDLHRPTTAPPTTPNVDITRQMLSLLTKCNDVVTHVTGLLGYAPYHPL